MPPLLVFLLYLVLTLVMTWPLASGLASDVPGDLGDSLLNMWILGWGAEQLPRVATGELSWRGFWDANIFHPEPLTLGLSEHLVGQVLQVAPVYWATGNLILAYNLLFLSTFALSGLGMYLLVRDLLGEERRFSGAAFIAGLIYAFVPLRIAQVAHIQSISSQWMPFALYGFRRFIHQGPASAPRRGLGRWWPLAGGAAALLMQNWSSGYYLVYFAPFVGLFVLHQIVASGRVRDWKLWTAFGAAAAVVAAGTWPFLSMYLATARVHAVERSLDEVMRFSADVYSYITAPEALRLWGHVLQVHPQPEGELFFGVVPVALGVVSLIGLVRPWRAPSRPTTTRAWVSAALVVVVVVQLAGLIAMVATAGFVTSVAGLPIRATNAPRLLTSLGAALLLLLLASPAARARARSLAGSPLALALLLTVLAVWLSLGPAPRSADRPLRGLGLYGWFHAHVPGVDGLRVPARYAMIAAVFASIAAGFGAHAVLRGVRRPLRWTAVIGGVFLFESAFVPMAVNRSWSDAAIPPPARVAPAARAPAVYRALASAGAPLVIAEFPFGDPAWDLRAVYYSTVHWQRLVNGYSGAFPRDYKLRVARLQAPSAHPEAAWDALRGAGTTHVVLHGAAYPPGEAAEVEAWLTAHGARIDGRFATDTLFALPVP